VKSAGEKATDEARWTVVASRQASPAPGFVYAVRTTGIYCRPSCPSRLAKRENVAFFASPAEAERGGFRACLRCRPQDNSYESRDAALIANACRMIEAAEEVPSLETLAAEAKLSPFHFHRLFKKLTGMTPKAYAKAHRADVVRANLAEQKGTVTQAIYESGFGSSSRFYATSKDVLGMAPKTFAKGGKGALIHYAAVNSSLGVMLVAESEKGICFIAIDDDEAPLIEDLGKRFPKADIRAGDAAFKAKIASIVAQLETPEKSLDLPLDIQGTAFQQRVWEALRAIPAGETSTYSEIAHRIGAPKAFRAVAQACGANKLAIAIPCHRVVSSNGDLSGYHWGVDRKRALLDKEKAAQKRRSKPR